MSASSSGCSVRCVKAEKARSDSISSPKSSRRTGSRPVDGKTSTMPTADRELAALLRLLDPLVAGEREALGQLLDARLVADARRIVSGRRLPGGTPSAAPSADAQTSPPAASTSSARARSPTRCGGGSSPLPQRTPRRSEQADVLLAEKPAGGLGGVASLGVVREDARRAARLARARQRPGRAGRSGSETRAGAGAATNSRRRSLSASCGQGR